MKGHFRTIPMLALALGAAAAAAAGPARADDLLRVGKAVAPPFSFVPIDVGVEYGIFKKHGLDIKISSAGGSSKLHQAMTGNSMDIGLGSGPGMAFIVKGSPTKAVAAMAGPPLLLVLVVRNDSGIKTIQDLKGRRISVSTVASLTNWLMRELSRQQGWGPMGIKITPLGRPSGQIAALKTKQTDGMVTALGIAYRLKEQGLARTLVRFGNLVKDFHLHVIYATDKLIKEKPDAVRRFVKAWFETIDFMHANKEKTVKVATRIMRTPPGVTAAIYDELMPMFSRDGKFNPKALATLRKSYVELGILKTEPDMSKLYTTRFLPGASG